MRGDRHSRPKNLFLCVIADQYPDHPYCDKSFPTIEKHKLVEPLGHQNVSVLTVPLVNT